MSLGLQGLSTDAARRCIGPNGGGRARRVQARQRSGLEEDMCEEGWGGTSRTSCNGTSGERVDVSGAWLRATCS